MNDQVKQSELLNVFRYLIRFSKRIGCAEFPSVTLHFDSPHDFSLFEVELRRAFQHEYMTLSGDYRSVDRILGVSVKMIGGGRA